MKSVKFSLISIVNVSIVSACLITPIFAQAGSFDSAAKEAKMAIEDAKAVNYEWRDSRKMLDKASKLNKAGKNTEAMKLVASAKQQGELALAQSKQQANVSGPHN